MSKRGNASHNIHSIIILSDKGSTHAIYEEILNYLSNDQAVIYAAEPNPSNKRDTENVKGEESARCLQ
ncbi:hypothetical protein Ngar_c08270 [Candidatus Nitrososphaera gargensis Ga9.2]|uniref:Uncharacterized protein n=1 Tax=Nitrososphaera gargensis (strain Ga9.2) TaxID=1237085 RepID=K0IMC4_NITGG|nr:hypothetical protein Ngar_c08270 [Candidatus Nitrososphaera gargensis Ga9.2]